MNDDKKYELLKLIQNYFNPLIYIERERVARVLNKMSIYINNEIDAQHSRPHAHIKISSKYGQIHVGRIWLDNFEVDLKNKNETDNKQRKTLNEWLKDNKQLLIDTWSKNNNVEIDY